MYGDILRGIIGIEIFPVLSLVIFTTLFTGALVRVARMTRPQIEHLSRLPLDDAADNQEASR